MVVATAAALLLSACSQTQVPANADSHAPLELADSVSTVERVNDLGFDTKDPVSLVEGLEAMPVDERPDDLIVSVHPESVQLQPGEPGELSIPLDTADFYLSIAPYVNETHPCTFHSLTTCLGELSNTSIELTVTDAVSGELVLSEQRVTADNGFVGVWLPRDRELVVQVSGEAGTGEQTVSTGAEDLTCLTTLQLEQ